MNYRLVKTLESNEFEESIGKFGNVVYRFFVVNPGTTVSVEAILYVVRATLESMGIEDFISSEIFYLDDNDSIPSAFLVKSIKCSNR